MELAGGGGGCICDFLAYDLLSGISLADAHLKRSACIVGAREKPRWLRSLRSDGSYVLRNYLRRNWIYCLRLPQEFHSLFHVGPLESFINFGSVG